MISAEAFMHFQHLVFLLGSAFRVGQGKLGYVDLRKVSCASLRRRDEKCYTSGEKRIPGSIQRLTKNISVNAFFLFFSVLIKPMRCSPQTANIY